MLCNTRFGARVRPLAVRKESLELACSILAATREALDGMRKRPVCFRAYPVCVGTKWRSPTHNSQTPPHITFRYITKTMMDQSWHAHYIALYCHTEAFDLITYSLCHWAKNCTRFQFQHYYLLQLQFWLEKWNRTLTVRKQWPRPRVLYWDRTPLGVRLVARRLCRRASSRTTSGVLYQYRIRARGHCLNSDPRKCGTLSPLCIITQMGFLAKFQLSQNQLNTFFYGQIIYKS